jgi:virginiamycin B lyase
MGRVRHTPVAPDGSDTRQDASGSHATHGAPAWAEGALRRLRLADARGGIDIGRATLALSCLVLVFVILLAVFARGASTPPIKGLAANTSAIVQTANVRTFQYARPDVGPMQPAVAPDGTVWVGEMTTNHLTRIDPRSGQVTSWTPPSGQYNIMATQVDSSGHVWFTEQAANYIGRFDPATQQFTTYPLGSANGRIMAPQDLRFDATGKLYVTLASGARIARLDPASGKLDMWPVPSPASGMTASPYALTVTPSGQVWFGLLGGGAVGHLDPATGKVTLLRLADSHAAVFSMTSDTAGRVWFTELQAGKLGVIDTATGHLQELDVPGVLGSPASLYAVAVAHNGDVWFASSGANAVVRFAPQTGVFTFFQLRVTSSVPYGLALDGAGNVWFTADAQSGNYLGELIPG